VGIAGIGGGMRSFGSSVLIKVLPTKFGFTTEQALAAAKEQNARPRR